MKSYKIMHMQAMGSFNWFKIVGWNILKRLWALRQADKLIKKFVEYGYPDSSAVMWLCSGREHHRNLNNKIPWKRVKKKGELIFDLSKPSKKFYKLWRLWLKKCKKYHHKFVPIMMMREDYCWYPFHNNVNGIDGINSPEALDVILAYMQKAVAIYIEVFDKTPMVIPYNEPAHHGNSDRFHKIMYDHEAMWEQALKSLGCKLKDVWPDLTLCEGSAGELIEPHDCPKPHGCGRGGRHGKDGQDRKVLGIKHGFTTLSDFMVEVSPGLTRLQNMVQSANHWRLYTEDWHDPVGDGKYLAGPFKLPLGDAQQQHEMMLELIRVWKEDGFLARYGTFPHEALSYDAGKNLFIPDYRPRKINWRRIRNGVLKACREEL